MPIVVLQLPDVKRQIATRPQECPLCGGTTFQRRGAVRKPVRDPRLRSLSLSLLSLSAYLPPFPRRV